MPCKDITDTLTLAIDADDRIIDYSLHKRTCGGAVGEEKLLGPWLFKRTAAQVIETPLDDFQAILKTKSDLKEYLVLKHFIAVKTALLIMLGREAGGLEDRCTVEYIDYGPEGIRMGADLSVDGLMEDIKACKSCCGSGKTFSV